MMGRINAQYHSLIEGFTARIVKHLACQQSVMRGQIITIGRGNWDIGGVPASILRRSELGVRDPD